eukprot:scaffold84219_cov34-Tisochrysis_lutea.AAC.3
MVNFRQRVWVRARMTKGYKLAIATSFAFYIRADRASSSVATGQEASMLRAATTSRLYETTGKPAL